jgi:acetyl-CoA C-acetyltransferase
LIAIDDDASGEMISLDECVRRNVTVEKLATFDPIFVEFGRQGYEAAFKAAFPELDELDYVHHAGNSPAIVDGASLVVIGSEEGGKANDLKPRARIRTMSNVSSNRLIALTGGIDAAIDALKKAAMSESDVELVEFNEAFASTSIKFARDTGWCEDQVNVNGGAIALGHAMGATGASLVGTLLDELERRDLSIGLVATSGASGTGTATIIERV